MSDFIQLFENVQQEQKIETAQANLFNLYSAFNLLKTSYSLIEKITEATGSLVVALDAIFPIVKLVLFSVKSAFDLLAIAKSFKHKQEALISRHKNPLQNLVVQLADDAKTEASIVKRLCITSAILSLTVTAICIPGIAWVLGIVNSTISLLNDGANYHYHHLALEAVMEKMAAKRALMQTTNPQEQKDLKQEISELEKQAQQCRFEMKDKILKCALNAAYLSAFVLIAIPFPPVQIIATAIFLVTMAMSFAYMKRGQKQLQESYLSQAKKNHQGNNIELKTYADKCNQYRESKKASELTWVSSRKPFIEDRIPAFVGLQQPMNQTSLRAY